MGQDREILRRLAFRYMEAACAPSHDEKRALYRAVNDLRQIRRVVLINEIPWNELNDHPELALQCQDPDFRAAEEFFRQIQMPTSIHEMGIELTEEQIGILAEKCSFDNTRTIGGFRVLNREDMAEIYRMVR